MGDVKLKSFQKSESYRQLPTSIFMKNINIVILLDPQVPPCLRKFTDTKKA